MNFDTCPRCGAKGYEHLRDYSHCVDCFYFHDRSVSLTHIISNTVGLIKDPKSVSVIPIKDLKKKSYSNQEKNSNQEQIYENF